MLEQEGFRYEGYVDIFDGGPTVECFRDDIHAVRASRVLPVQIGEDDPVPDSLPTTSRGSSRTGASSPSVPCSRRRPRASTGCRCCRSPRRSSASATATSCAPSRSLPATDECGLASEPDRGRPGSDPGLAPEINFDGIPGPTHNYAGLAHGNLAAERHAQQVANPREAALQGLAKMRALAARGFPQAVLPPHERPFLPALRALGFAGSDAEVLARAAREAPRMLAACSSAAAMWVANAATVSPSADTADGRVHFTPANLVSHFHRAIEAATTTRVLRAIFADARKFVVHDPLPAAPQLGDEGAANHTRFAGSDGTPGVELFVYGRAAYDAAVGGPRQYPARQTREACEAIARRHGLDPARTVFAQQHPDAIDAGVFHNDVIAVGHDAVLFCHEQAWVEQPAVLAAPRRRGRSARSIRSSFARAK